MDDLKTRINDFWIEQNEAMIYGDNTGIPDEVERLMLDMTDYIDELEAQLADKS